MSSQKTGIVKVTVADVDDETIKFSLKHGEREREKREREREERERERRNGVTEYHPKKIH